MFEDVSSAPVLVAFATRHGSTREVAASQSQLDHALAGVREVTPVSIGLFGGVIDPARLRFPFNRMPASDARDWDAIRAWACDLAQLLAKAHA
jgi:menaquinone-dependent protoporphyrinogen oxidase